MGGRIDDFAVVEGRPPRSTSPRPRAGCGRRNNGTTLDRSSTTSPSRRSATSPSRRPTRPSCTWARASPTTASRRRGATASTRRGRRRDLDPWAWPTRTTSAAWPSTPRGRTSSTWPRSATCGEPNKERGLYRSTDGGRSWTNTKFIDEDTGFVDVAMDPESPSTLYAASCQRRRTPFGYSGGGPGSALWKTTDGGETWKKIGAACPSQGDLAAAASASTARTRTSSTRWCEHADGGVFRSEDKGATWKKMSDTTRARRITARCTWTRPTTSGCTSWARAVLLRRRGQDLPPTPRGSTATTTPSGSPRGLRTTSWPGPTAACTSPTTAAGAGTRRHHPARPVLRGRFDMQTPYRVYGGLQDNGSWGGPAAPSAGHLPRGLGPRGRRRRLLRGGRPRRPGHRLRGEPVRQPVPRRRRTAERRASAPARGRPLPVQLELAHPALSPRPQDALLRRQPVFGSGDRGDTWSVVSEDLTTRLRS